MTLFFPDKVLPDDPPGMSFWVAGHYYEHNAMNAAALTLASKAEIPDYDLYKFPYDMGEQLQDWLNGHQAIHYALRQVTGVGGYDLSQVNFNSREQFFDWQQFHADEHRQLRQVLGLS